MLTVEEILSYVKARCAHSDPVIEVQMSPKGIRISASDVLTVMEELRDHPSLFFDSLSCVTGIDNGPASDMEVIYNLCSIPFGHHLAIKVKLDRSAPQVESVSAVWRAANWLEREVFDMYGIVFLNHPDLRRILMPADWEGYPLRKDYQQQAYYRDIKVEY